MTYYGKNVSFITFNMIIARQKYYTVQMDSKIKQQKFECTRL